MGNWNMTVRGVGCHHNREYPTDANRMFAAFVKSLKDAGHQIEAATITFGGQDDVSDPIEYLRQRDEIEKQR